MTEATRQRTIYLRTVIERAKAAKQKLMDVAAYPWNMSEEAAKAIDGLIATEKEFGLHWHMVEVILDELAPEEKHEQS